jgi:hypothetical protein
MKGIRWSPVRPLKFASRSTLTASLTANAPRHSLQDHVRVRTSISSVFPITTSPPRLSLDFPRSTSFFDDNSPIQSRIETLATVNEDITPKRRPLGILTNLPPRLLTPTKRSKVPNLDKTPRNTTPALLTTKNKTPITKKKTSITTVLVPESSPEIQGTSLAVHSSSNPL